MKVDIYTKVVLTVIAVALCLIAVKPFLQPDSAQAAGKFDNILVVGDMAFMDKSTGEIWRYNVPSNPGNIGTLVELGKPMLK